LGIGFNNKEIAKFHKIFKAVFFLRANPMLIVPKFSAKLKNFEILGKSKNFLLEFFQKFKIL